MPTKPSSSSSGLTNIILFSFVVIDFVAHFWSLKVFIISLLNSIKTSSTTLIVFLSVTLRPFIKVLSIFSLLNLLLILFPPPCKIIGVNPRFFITTTS